MSCPENPLARFRTYSYHFLLAMCANSDAAARFQTPGAFDSATNPGQTSNRSADSDINVLINSKTDSDLFIDDVKIMNLFVPQGDSGVGAASNSLFSTEATMKVVEPRGLQFMNFIRDTHAFFESDAAGIIWVLQVQFVGHDDQVEGSSQQEVVVKTIALEYYLMEIVANFTVKGTEYDLIFASTGNGISRLPQTTRALDRVSIADLKDKTYGGAVKALEKNINDDYARKFEKSKAANGGVVPGAKVIYALDPGVYADCVMDQITPTKTNDGNPTEGRGYYSFGKNAKIDSTLVDLVGFCKEVQKDKEDKPGERKALPNVISVQLDGMRAQQEGNRLGVAVPDGGYLLIYKIIKREQPLALNDFVEQSNQRRAEAVKGKDFIEFNYFFTGKNTDIINLDLRMNMAIAFVHGVDGTATVDSSTNEPVTNSGHVNDTTVINQTQDKRTRKNTPFYIGSTVKNRKVRNKINATQMAKYYADLAKQAGWEMLEANMTIVGNPALLANLNPDPVTMINGGVSSFGTNIVMNADGTDIADVNPNWQVRPGLVKVNIRHQLNGEDNSTQPTFDSTEFWYDDLYYLLGVESRLSGGKFTQDFMMMSIPFASSETDSKPRNTIEAMSGGTSRVAGDVAPDSQNFPKGNVPPTDFT